MSHGGKTEKGVRKGLSLHRTVRAWDLVEALPAALIEGHVVLLVIKDALVATCVAISQDGPFPALDN